MVISWSTYRISLIPKLIFRILNDDIRIEHIFKATNISTNGYQKLILTIKKLDHRLVDTYTYIGM